MGAGEGKGKARHCGDCLNVSERCQATAPFHIVNLQTFFNAYMLV